jgi:glycosyltransferase involved in cell wall biosynthesis
MRVLVWQWGRRGAGPRFAAALAEGLRQLPGTEALLSLSTGAEILQELSPPCCELPVTTYSGVIGLACRLAQAPLIISRLTKRIAEARFDVAICAMPSPLDLLLLAALRRTGVPAVVVVHDAAAHPGDSMPLLMTLQRQFVRRADGVVALSKHVATQLSAQRLVNPDKLFVVSHPPFIFGPRPAPPGAHSGALRLLCFGRLLPYKGLDLLAGAIRELGQQPSWELRVVGSGPETAELAVLRALPGVTVENRWVPENEIGALIAWADVLVLPYKEASQSGVAPTAIAAGRLVVATRVDGLIEQLHDEILATLCEPDVTSLAAALRSLIGGFSTVPSVPMPANPAAAWRDIAELLLRQINATILGRGRH